MSAKPEIGKTWPCQQLEATPFLGEQGVVNFLNMLQQDWEASRVKSLSCLQERGKFGC